MKRTLVVAALALAGVAQAAEITVYKQQNFTGDALTLRGDNTDLAARGFQDQISSIVVKSGTWQVCSMPNYQGDCATLGPGEYRTLEQRINHRIESAREVSAQVADNRGAREGAYSERYGYRDRYAGNGYRVRGAVELYTAPDFGGEAMRLNRDASTLDQFDRRISSLVIREGRWQVCTRPGYEGRCDVLEPGRYADLGRMDNRIGSLRRVG